MTVTKEKFYIIKPKAATNLCTNPSFETGTTGWTKGGTNAIATSAVQQRRGVYSCKCTYVNNDLLASYAITLTLADTDHVASMDIYIPSDYEGTQLTLTWTGFTSATVVSGLADMTIRDKWQRVHCHINPDAGDLAGTLTLSETGTNGDATEFIYIDGVLIEADTAPTTYFDGNIIETIKKVNQYYWTGQENASTSVRLATTRSGGELIDITDYCKKIDVIGLGMAPTDVNSINLVDGTKRYQRTNLTSRYFTLAVAFNGTTIGAVQSNRNALIELVKPDLVPYDQPLVIRYQGETTAGLAASEPIDIKCVYVSGLDTGLQRDFERANIVFEIQDAYLKKDGNRAISLDYNDTLANANYIVKRDRDGVWSAMAGVTGTILAIAQHPITKEIWIGGDFQNAGGDPDADYLAKWDVATGAWVSVVAGINAPVRDLVFDASGNLYIGGAFSDLGDANGDGIVKWDGSSLSSLGSGLTLGGSACFTIAIDSNGMVYAGGGFTAAGGVANTARIAKWDGTVWTPLSTGLTSTAYKIVVDKSDNLFIVGLFINAGDANGDYVVKWTGSAWESLGTGSDVISFLYSAFLDEAENLYVGGDVTTLGGITVANWGRWNGYKWEALGDGVNREVYEIIKYKDKIYLSGVFTSAGDIDLSDRVAVYLGNGVYQPLDINLPGNPIVYRLLFDNLDNLYLGFSTSGNAETAGDDTVTNAGTAKTYPIITVTGPGLLRQIVNTTTGKGIYFNNLTLLSGEVITLDLRPGRISMASTFRGSVLGYVLPGSSYDFPLMPGSNRIATFIDGTTDSNTTATMQWVENYHGIDGAQYA
jgi:hypothetical protein